MSSAQEIAESYFRLSNKSDFEGIAQLLTDSTTYSSAATGLFLGSSDILAMQKSFHNKFDSLQWTVNSVKETKPGIILFDYTFEATLPDGERLTSDGLESVIVRNGKIVHIEIRSK